MLSMRVSYSDLEDAFLFASDQRHHWLDKRTGRILSYDDEAVLAVEEDDLDDLPEWMEDEVKAAREVLRAFGELPQEGKDEDAEDVSVEPDRYVSIEQIPSHEAFQFMADFTGELNDAQAREALGRALAGNSPFAGSKTRLTVSQ
jgi:hypothetical protein